MWSQVGGAKKRSWPTWRAADDRFFGLTVSHSPFYVDRETTLRQTCHPFPFALLTTFGGVMFAVS